MKPTDAMPVLATSKPTPPPPPLEEGIISSRLSLASFAFSWPRWKDVALFCERQARYGRPQRAFWVFDISSSISFILATLGGVRGPLQRTNIVFDDLQLSAGRR